MYTAIQAANQLPMTGTVTVEMLTPVLRDIDAALQQILVGLGDAAAQARVSLSPLAAGASAAEIVARVNPLIKLYQAMARVRT